MDKTFISVHELKEYQTNRNGTNNVWAILCGHLITVRNSLASIIINIIIRELMLLIMGMLRTVVVDLCSKAFPAEYSEGEVSISYTGLGLVVLPISYKSLQLIEIDLYIYIYINLALMTQHIHWILLLGG